MGVDRVFTAKMKKKTFNTFADLQQFLRKSLTTFRPLAATTNLGSFPRSKFLVAFSAAAAAHGAEMIRAATLDDRVCGVVLAPSTDPVRATFVTRSGTIVDFDLPKIEDIYRIMNRLLDKGVPPESKAYAWKVEFQKDEDEKLKVAEAALGLTSVEIDNVLAK